MPANYWPVKRAPHSSSESKSLCVNGQRPAQPADPEPSAKVCGYQLFQGRNRGRNGCVVSGRPYRNRASHLTNNAAYLAGWIKALKGDAKLVIVAAAAAQKATDYILSRQTETAQETAIALAA